MKKRREEERRGEERNVEMRWEEKRSVTCDLLLFEWPHMIIGCYTVRTVETMMVAHSVAGPNALI